jgi:hypothetical protein
MTAESSSALLSPDCILLREDISSLEQPGNGHCQQGSTYAVSNYLDQQKHFVCCLFNPPCLEADIIMFAEFVKNLGQLVVPLLVKIHVANLLISGSHLQLGEPGPQVKTSRNCRLSDIKSFPRQILTMSLTVALTGRFMIEAISCFKSVW